jgi:TolB protein
MVEITKTLSRTSMMILLPCALLVILSLLVGQARFPSVISFASSSEAGTYHLYLMDIYLDRMHQISDHDVYCCPNWSPDGQEIIYIQVDGRRKRLYHMNANGGHPQPLTAPSAPDTMFAAWSPDGSSIVYTRIRLMQDLEIAVLDTRTGMTRELTHNSQDDDSPQWSPDGRFIVFRSRSDNGEWDIYRMNPQGEDVQQLTGVEDNDLFPSISPDGRRISFVSDRSGNPDLYVMNADGSNVRQLTWTPAAEMNPFWSPDGSRILFQSQLQGAASADIYLIEADGGHARQLITDTRPILHSAPFWSPNGQYILFVSENATGGTDISVMDVTGSQVRRLTNNVNPDTFPAWLPR